MNFKKAIGSVLAFALAFGSFAALPELTGGAADTAIEASAAEYFKTVNGFVLNKDSDGDIYVSDYTGKGGKITIPENAKYIGKEAFKGNTDITGVTFPKGTTTYGIGESAFAWCTNLQTVTINGDVGKDGNDGIGDGAFLGCHMLSKVSFTKKNAYVAYIGENAFLSCYNLSIINIPTGTKVIRDSAFENCAKLKSVTIPQNTKLDGAYIFGYMYGADNVDDYYEYLYNDNDKVLRDIKATGMKTVYWCLDAANNKTAEKLSGDIFGKGADYYYYGYDDNGDFVIYDYSFCVPVKQCEITLNVTTGSNAEKWAKKYGIKYKSSAPKAPATKPGTPKNLEATKTAKTVTLVWDDVKGADAYRVYKYNTSTGKYEKYSTVTSSKCKITGLSANKTYKFKVVALKKSGNSYIEGTGATISVTTNKA